MLKLNRINVRCLGATPQLILVNDVSPYGSRTVLMNDDSGFITRADRRVIGSLIRNLIIAAVFTVCALGSQWFWELLLDPASLMGKAVTIFCQIAFGLVAAAHVVSAVIVQVNHLIRDTVKPNHRAEEMTMKKSIDLLRPSDLMSYPIMGYGVVLGVVDGWIKLWSDHTYDYALAYGFSAGLATMLGLLIGTQAVYRINVLFLRYIRAIKSHLERTKELTGSSLVDQTSAPKVPFLFRAITWAYVISIVVGTVATSVAVCHLAILSIMGFPDWIDAMSSLFVGLGVMVAGVFVGLWQCYQLDRQAKRLRRVTIAHLSETKVIGPVSDGTDVVATMQMGVKLVGTLTGVRSKALTAV